MLFFCNGFFFFLCVLWALAKWMKIMYELKADAPCPSDEREIGFDWSAMDWMTYRASIPFEILTRVFGWSVEERSSGTVLDRPLSGLVDICTIF
jgi:hypothetical protein